MLNRKESLMSVVPGVIFDEALLMSFIPCQVGRVCHLCYDFPLQARSFLAH